MKKLAFALIVFPFALFAQSPGGISTNLRWWLKSDAGVQNTALATAANNDAVGRWLDQSAVANNATQSTSALAPIYLTNIINGYPALRFNGTKFLDAAAAPGITGTTGFDYFMVFKQSAITAGGTGDGAGDYILDRQTATTPLTSFKMVNTDKYFFQERDNGGSIGGPISSVSANTSLYVIAHYYRNAGYGMHINGANNVVSGDNGALDAPALRIGRHATATAGGLQGDFAEMAIYNSPVTNPNRNQIESYLAVKYGITLDQTVATNYTSSTGTVIYHATTTHDLYDRDIAGIGVDNGSGLAQAASQSQNANSLLKISNSSPALTTGQFMLWGNDSPTISNSSNTPSGYTNRLSRVWRMAKTGVTGNTVSVQFDLSGLGIPMTDPTKFALLIDDDGNFSDAVAFTNGRTIVGNIVSFTLASIAHLDYFTLASDLVPGPGGVGGVVVWLRADKNVYINAGTTLATANNDPVQQWNNQGSTTYNVTQATAANKPTYQLSVLNNNPVLRFASGGTSTFLDAGPMGIGGTSDLDYTVVVRPSSTANAGTVTDANGGYIIDRSAASPSDFPLMDLKLTTPTLFGFQKRNDANASLGGINSTSASSTVSPQIVEFFRTYNVQYGIAYNGGLENTLSETDGSITLPNLRIGATRTNNNGLNGDIAEVIFYNRTLSSLDRNKMNTYLAIKYGITLNQSTLTNYIASDGTTVLYPTTTTHSGYKFNITGIGQDPISSLIQTNSLSTNANPVVRMSVPSNLNDYEFMIWGDNNGNLGVANTSDVGAPVIRRMSRVWRVAEKNGDVGTVTITMDLTNVGGSKSASDLRFLIDRNNNGFADNDVPPNASGTLVGQIYTITGINLQDGDFFTLGSINLSTPLPIQLVDFTVQDAGGSVQAQWITETEKNNDFFTIERSREGQEFEVVGNVKGAGNSNNRLTYNFVDRNPYSGLSYYRLKQTDYDGTSTLSKIKSVTIGSSELNGLIIYPNPAEGSGFTLQFKSESSGKALIEILSITGQKLYSDQKNDVGAGINTWPIENTSRLPSGIYLARVNVDGRLLVTKLVVK